MLFYGSEMIFWECVESKTAENCRRMRVFIHHDRWFQGDSKWLSDWGLKYIFKQLRDSCRNGYYKIWKKYLNVKRIPFDSFLDMKYD